MILPSPPRDAARLGRLGLLVAAAALPAALVVGDRWLGLAALQGLGRAAVWCRVPALCRSAWPSYMALAWLALVFVAGGFVAWRLGVAVSRPADELPLDLPPVGPRQARWSTGLALAGILVVAVAGLRSLAVAWRAWAVPVDEPAYVPGWGLALGLLSLALAAALALVPASWVLAAWRRHGRRWRAQAVLVLAGGTTLWALYTPPAGGVACVLALALVAVALVWRDLRASGPVFWLALLAALLAGIHLTAWWRVIVGDEYIFYYAAADLAFGRPQGEALPQLFDVTWVYSTHPFLSTLIQAVGLRLLGDTVFGWRFQDVLLVAAALPLFCAALAAFCPRQLALFAGLFLALSSYLAAFAKIGYNNLQAYLAMALALAAAALAVRARRPAASLLLGLALGACFYSFPAALYVLPLPLLLLALYDPPRGWPALGRWAVVGAGCLALAWPALIQPGFWSTRLAGTLAQDPRLQADLGAAATHLGRNLGYAAFSWLYAVDESHFVVVAHVDPLTATLAALGLGCALTAALRRDRFAWFMLVSGGLLLFLAGASHDKPAPPNTRMFLLVPWYAWLAALGLAWLLDELAAAWPVVWGLGGRRRLVRALAGLLLLVALGLSYTQAYPLTRRRLAAEDQPLEAQFVRLARLLDRGRDPGEPAPGWLFLYPADTLDPAAFRYLARLYQLPPTEVATADPRRPTGLRAVGLWLDSGAGVLVVRPDLAATVEGDLGPDLRRMGYASRGLWSEGGLFLAVLWVAPEWQAPFDGTNRPR